MIEIERLTTDQIIVLKLLVGSADENGVIAGISQARMKLMLVGTMDRSVGYVLAELKTLQIIAGVKPQGGGPAVYHLLDDVPVDFTAQAAAQVRQWRDFADEHERREREREAERERQRQEWWQREEERRQREREAAEQEDQRRLSQLTAEQDQFEAAKPFISRRLAEVNQYAQSEFAVTVQNLNVFFGYPAKRASFDLVIPGVGTLPQCALYMRRSGKPSVGGPSYKAGSSWKTHFDFEVDFGNWLAVVLTWALDGGQSPFAVADTQT